MMVERKTPLGPELIVGSDRALELRSREARMLFSLGPARGGSARPDRAGAALDALKPGLRAIRWCDQIHGNLVASLGSKPGQTLRDAACVGRCDALITPEAGVGLLVWTADCVPVLIAGGGVVAAVHAGWRGAACDVVGAVVRRFEIEFGVSADSLAAGLGPAVSAPNYPVGPEVIEALGALPVEESRWRDGNHVDLRGFLAARLEGLGLGSQTVTEVGSCTAASPELASHRRDGAASGRQWSLVYRVAGTGPEDPAD